MKKFFWVVAISVLSATSTVATPAVGMGINMPVIGRLTGGGGVLYATSLDISNNLASAAQVDFYFDGVDVTTQGAIVLNGSLNNNGIVAQGSGTVRAQSNIHFDDFVDALVKAGRLTQAIEADGVLGSTLFVFNGANAAGQGAVVARFYNAACGGTVGVSLQGHVMTTSEPQALVATMRDTRATAGAPAQLYPNMFLNNSGLAPNGVDPAGAVVVTISAVSNTTGQATGSQLTVSIPSGQTVSIGNVLGALQVPPGSDDTILVYARVTQGDASIEGIISQVDAVTKDGSAFEMSRSQ